MLNFNDCINDDDGPEGMYAKVASSAVVMSRLGDYSKVGDHAYVGRNSNLGSWSSVGHFARVEDNVTFGPWASVGMCSVVPKGYEFLSHEYLPSGHYFPRHSHCLMIGTNAVRMDGFSEEDWQVFYHYDKVLGSIGPSAHTHDMAAWLNQIKLQHAEKLADLLPAFLERRNVYRRERGFASRLLALVGR